MSSSPGLPSPSLLLRKKGPNARKASWLTGLPQANDTDFMTAASLLKVGSLMSTKVGKVGGDDAEHKGSDDARARTFPGTSPSRQDQAALLTHAKDAGVKRSALATKTAKRARMAGAKPNKVEVVVKSCDGQGLRDAADNALQGAESGCMSKSKPRTRAKKTGSQTKIAVDSITKPCIPIRKKRASVAEFPSSTVDSSVQGVSHDTASQQKALDINITKGKALSGDQRDLLLDGAARRRMEWTPPIDTGLNEMDGTSTAGLFSTFVYSDASDRTKVAIAARPAGGEALRKRRRIDLVENHPVVDLTSPGKKPRAVKKKPRTITERATAIYVTENPKAVSPILQYVTEKGPSSGQQALDSLHAAVVDPRGADYSKQRTIAGKVSTRLGRSTLKGGKKQNILPLPLLQPIDAQKEIDDQQFVFGTSSQLAEAETSETVRDIQQALIASEGNMGILTPVSPNGDREVACLSFSNIDKPPLTSRQSLWSEAARDSDGSFMSPQPMKATSLPLVQQSLLDLCNIERHTLKADRRIHHPTTSNSSSWACVGQEVPPTSEDKWMGHTQDAQNKKEASPTAAPSIIPSMAPEVASSARSDRKLPRVKEPNEALQNMQRHGSLPNTVALTAPDKPAFKGFPTSRLATELKSYGFKPVKSRNHMILLLERCWEGKHRIALQTLHSNRILPNPSQDPSLFKGAAEGPLQTDRLTLTNSSSGESTRLTLPMPQISMATEHSMKRPRGRPRKDVHLSMSTGIALEESSIQKTMRSAHDLAPPKSSKLVNGTVKGTFEPPIKSAPRLRRLPPSPSTSSDDTDAPPIDDTLTLTPTTARVHLFESITKAVTAVPPSTDVNKPTWHEKMLMYDPIVLEDLGTWLNTQGLANVGVDREVGAVEVREWCEKNSVCCLWKENLREGVRSRY